MSDEIDEKVRKIIAEQAMRDVAEVTPDTTPEQLELDSLALVEVVFAIEEEFGITVPYNANDPQASEFSITNVQTVIDGVRKLVTEQA